ncbi:FG-GAP repeat domain-containing protein, partial [Fulvivirga lutimaris]|uniref:FG-GAP repeat domain-containing protein n=1 Tax=Fulvivirga lutimaris TaxID=1819566 RepID=UPI0012BC8C09
MNLNIYFFACFLLLTCSIGYAQNSFEGRRLVDVGQNPNDLISADFDNDNYPDIAVANYNENTVFILYNDSKGGIRKKTLISTLSTPLKIASAELNGDSFDDLIVLNSDLNSITIFYNLEGAGFSSGKTVETGTMPLDIKTFDINNNTFKDIIVLNNDGSVTLFHNDGLGNFSSDELLLGFNSENMAIAQLNLDNHADLVFTNSNLNEISIFYGSSNGIYSSSTHATGTSPKYIEIVDIDNNTYNDILISHPFNDEVSILHNENGTDSFTSSSISVSDNPRFIRTHYIDDDNILDLVVNTQLNVMSIYIGNGDGSFSFDGTTGFSADIGTFEFIDFDLNGKVDAIATLFNEDQLEILNGNNAGGFGPLKIDIPSYALNTLANYDVNGDGNEDLVIANQFAYAASNHILTVVHGDGNGGFNFDQNLFIGSVSDITSIKFDFLNDDTNIDIAALTTSSGDVSILYGDGTGNFDDLNIIEVGANPTSMIIENLNNDDYKDIITNDRNSNNFTILFGDELSQYSSNSTISTSNSSDFGLVDFNNDSKLDIINSSHSDLNLNFYEGLGNGNFLSPTEINTEDEKYVWIEFSDIDGDGDKDLIGAGYFTDTFSIFLNDGVAGFNKSQSLNIEPSCRPRIEDINGDGIVDIAVLSDFTNLVILYGNGKGKFDIVEKYFLGVGQWANDLTVADFNNDSKNDIVVPIKNKQRLFIYLNTNQTDDESPIPQLLTEHSSPVSVERITLSLVFNELINGTLTSEHFNVENGVVSGIENTNNQDYTLTLEPITDGNVNISLREGAVADLNGNLNALSNNIEFVFDNTLPLVSFDSSNPAATNLPNISLTLTTNEPIEGLEITDFVCNNCDITNINQLDSHTYQISLSSENEGITSIELTNGTYSDLQGNLNSENSVFQYVYDQTPPSTSIELEAQSEANSFLINILFSEEIVGFEANDIIVNNAMVEDFQALNEDYFQLRVNSDNCDLIELSILNGSASDLAGNLIQGVDSYIINQASGQLITELSLDKNDIGENVIVNAIFNKPLASAPNINSFTLTNGEILSITEVDSKTYTLEILPDYDFDSLTLKLDALQVFDACLNGNKPSDILVVDTANPRSKITFTQIQKNNDGTIGVEINFSLPTGDFSEQNLTLTNLEVTNFDLLSETDFTVTLTPINEDVASIKILENVTYSIYGYGNIESDVLAFDVISPIININSLEPFTNNDKQTIEISISESTTSLDVADISLQGADITSFEKTQDNRYSLGLLLNIEGEIILSISSESVYDSAGNPNKFLMKKLTTFDQTRPSFSYNIDGDTLKLIPSEPTTSLTIDKLSL